MEDEGDYIEYLEIPVTIDYLSCNYPTCLPNLKKLFITPYDGELWDDSEYGEILFGHGAFSECEKLEEVHLYRPMCFVNRLLKASWEQPFEKSKKATFYYHFDYIEATMDLLFNEINRWGLEYKIIEHEKEKYSFRKPYHL